MPCSVSVLVHYFALHWSSFIRLYFQPLYSSFLIPPPPLPHTLRHTLLLPLLDCPFLFITCLSDILTGCAAIGMSGLCCPTPEGSILACCDSAPGGEKRMQDEWKSLMFLDHAGTSHIDCNACHFKHSFIIVTGIDIFP